MTGSGRPCMREKFLRTEITVSPFLPENQGIDVLRRRVSMPYIISATIFVYLLIDS